MSWRDFDMAGTIYMRRKPATLILEAVGQGLWGFRPNLMAHIVERRGQIGALMWFAFNMPRYERILKRWGALRTHLACTLISTLHGCRYCAHGHAYAFELHYFNDTGRLFPLDEQAVIELQLRPVEDVVASFESALIAADMADEKQLVRQAVELCAGAQADAPARDDLVHLVNMFAVLNNCGISSRAAHDQAHDPINRDLALRRRYAAERAGIRAVGRDDGG